MMGSQSGLRVVGRDIFRFTFILLLVCTALSTASAVPAGHRYWASEIHQQPLPGIRFTSGLTVCDEVLWKGRWVNRYWLSTGFIEPESHLGSAQERLEGLPIDGFQLAMEGQDLAGTWRWVKAEKAEVHNPDGLLVTLELASTARPIFSKTYTVTFSSSGRTLAISGDRLLQEGIPVRLEGNLGSELLIFQAR